MNTATKYSVSDAATLYKKSRATLYKDIKNGVLSRDHDGFIDFSELLRVYGEPFGVKQVKRIDTSSIQNQNTSEYTNKTVVELKNQIDFLKKQLEKELSKGFILKRSVFQKCLELFPINEWDETMLGVNKLNRFTKKNNDFIRRYTAGLKHIELDNAGRILIPKDLINFSHLKKNIVMSTALNIIEIWDKEMYENAINDSNVDFAKLTEEVMGNDDNNVS